MIIVRTWCEDTKEGENYLRYNGYEKATRIPFTKFFLCRKLGTILSDVKVVL